MLLFERRSNPQSGAIRRSTSAVARVILTTAASGGCGCAADIASAPLQTKKSRSIRITAATPIATAAAIFFPEVGFWPVARPVCPFTRNRNTRSL